MQDGRLVPGSHLEEDNDIIEVTEDPDAGTYTPPVDPVMRTDERGNAEIVGGFSTSSLDDVVVPRSETLGPGDEALAGAIMRELRQDAMTSDLDIEIEVREGVAYLRGSVEDMTDVEAAEEVAGRVPGVREVVDALEVRGL